MSFDPKFNPYRKKALEQGMEDGWDFSDFFTRPQGYSQSTQPIARSLATILAYTRPIIPHAPRFSLYLQKELIEVKCDISLDKQREGGYLKTVYDISSGDGFLGVYIVRERKDGGIFWQLFEGNIDGKNISLEFERTRKDRFLHIPFP